MRSLAALELLDLNEESEYITDILIQAVQEESVVRKHTLADACFEMRLDPKVKFRLLLQNGMKHPNLEKRSMAAMEAGELGKTADWSKPMLAQWIEQHQDLEFVGSGIDALWEIVEGGGMGDEG